jgi:DNA polymerase elongation subunit (family B)
MKKLFNWLNKHGYKYNVRSCGESHYFYNAPGCIQETAEITISGLNIRDVSKKAEALQKYITKYNYVIYNAGRIHCDIYGEYSQTFFIITEAAAAALENYYLYRNAAIAQCELFIHEAHENGTYKTHHAELENQLRAIMDDYGTLYNRSLLKLIKAA